jgi:hypothetical protein
MSLTSDVIAEMERVHAEVVAERDALIAELAEMKAIEAEAERIRQETLQDFMNRPLVDDDAEVERLKLEIQDLRQGNALAVVIADLEELYNAAEKYMAGEDDPVFYNGRYRAFMDVLAKMKPKVRP